MAEPRRLEAPETECSCLALSALISASLSSAKYGCRKACLAENLHGMTNICAYTYGTLCKSTRLGALHRTSPLLVTQVRDSLMNYIQKLLLKHNVLETHMSHTCCGTECRRGSTQPHHRLLLHTRFHLSFAHYSHPPYSLQAPHNVLAFTHLSSGSYMHSRRMRSVQPRMACFR